MAVISMLFGFTTMAWAQEQETEIAVVEGSERVSKFKSGNLTFDIIADKAVSLSYVDAIDDVMIPDTVRGYNVVRIDADAFKWCSQIQTLVIPASVDSIGVDFASGHGFSQLRSVTVAPANKVFSSENGALFNKDK
ncbi:MAG: leucine-rich repeat domain-containing protein, partial [Bacteroidales bacterium]|nr:leucine-rich repeat domain-containing protein [Bacteroidales bacterium]